MNIFGKMKFNNYAPFNYYFLIIIIIIIPWLPILIRHFFKVYVINIYSFKYNNFRNLLNVNIISKEYNANEL